MSSNEEYLDNLLKSMQEKEEKPVAEPSAASSVNENAPTVDDLSNMSADDITNMLKSFDNQSSDNISEEALLAEAMKDSAIQEINDLLYKNDNGEYVEPDPETSGRNRKAKQPSKKEEAKEKKGLLNRLGFGRNRDKSEPVVEKTKVTAPVVEEIPVEEPVVEEPVIEEPVIEEPLIEEPIIEEPAIEINIADDAPVVESAEDVSLADMFMDAPIEGIDEVPAEEAPAEETASEELLIEEPVIEEVAIERNIVDDTPVVENAEDVSLADMFMDAPIEGIDEAPVEEVPVEETPAVEISAEEIPVEETSATAEIADMGLEGLFGDSPVEGIDEMPAEEAPADELIIEEPVIEEVPAEEPVIEEAAVEEASVEEPVIDETPVEEVPVEETPAVEIPAEEIPAEEPVVEETPVEETPVEETPVEETPVEEVPVEEAPAEEAPAEDMSDEESLSELFGDMIIEPSSEEHQLVEEPNADLDEGLDELLKIAGVTEADFSGESDGATDASAPAEVADGAEVEGTEDGEMEGEAAEGGEESLLGDDLGLGADLGPGEEVPAEEATGDDASVDAELADLGLDGLFTEAPVDEGGETAEAPAEGGSAEVSTEGGEATDLVGDMESLLFSSFEEADESAKSADDVNADDIDALMGLMEAEGVEIIDGDGSAPEGENAEATEDGKKKGRFAKFIELLTESDDDDEEEENGSKEKFSFKNLFKKKGAEEEAPAEGEEGGADAEGATTDENKEVNRQLDAEEEDDGKKKKKKKKRKKGEPEGAEELEEREPHEIQAGRGGDDEDEEGGDDKGKKKKKKEKKKKEPKPVDNRPLPKLSKKKVKATFLFATSLLAIIIVCCFFLGDFISVQKAKSAYYNGEYMECYRNMYGKKLSEDEEVMFKKAQMLLAVDRSQQQYFEYLAIDDEYHALDALLIAVANKDGLMENAAKYGFEAEALKAYNEVLNILETMYGITEEDALWINSIESNAAYTIYVKSVVDGVDYELPDYMQDGYVENRVNEIMNAQETEAETEGTEEVFEQNEETEVVSVNGPNEALEEPLEESAEEPAVADDNN